MCVDSNQASYYSVNDPSEHVTVHENYLSAVEKSKWGTES